MTDQMRRNFLVGAAASAAALGVTAAGAATFGNPDTPPERRINAKSPTALSEPGPRPPSSCC